MISVFEQRDQLAELERRRQQIAAQQTAAQQAAAQQAPVPASAGGVTAAMPGGFGPATALKAADPDVVKRRKDRGERKGHDLARETAATGPHDVARGAEDAAEEARKTFRDRGITAGPDDGTTPGHPAPEAFDRDYLTAGHAAESPMSAPPRENPNPVPSQQRGTPTPVALPNAHVGVQHANIPNGVRAGAIPVQIQAQYSLGSPSEPGR